MFILKQLRRKKNVNQTDLAAAIGVSLRTIQLYEKKDANIPIKNLTKIAQYFDVSIAELYSHESVSELGVAYDNLGKRFQKGHTINKLAPGKYLVSVPLVLAEQYGNFIGQHRDPAYVRSLPQISFTIDQVSIGHYMAFEISNDSMDDRTLDSIPKKTVVLGKLVPENKLGKIVKSNLNTYWVIVHNQSIMCKEIAFFERNKGILTCRSLNPSPEYSDFDMKIEDVQQFYKVIKKQVE